MFAAIDELEFPELHDGSIPVMAFMTNLGGLLQASGINDLSLKVCGSVEMCAVVQPNC